MIDPTELPPFAVEHARAFLEAERVPPAAPRLAATTVLVRGGRQGVSGSVEVFMQRRRSTMAFAASALVFPGGGVDPRDRDGEDDWVGPAPSEWSALLDVSEPEARAVVCAAVRELFEESGVLLAGPDAGSVVSGLDGDEWEAVRAGLERRDFSLSEMLAARGLRLRADLLAPWRCWLTPEFEPKRYRTFFLVARMPDGQRGRTASGESDESVWIEVGDALAAAGTEHLLLPPQVCTCAELVPFDSAEEVLDAARRERRPDVSPTVALVGDGVRLVLPGDLVQRVEAAAAELVR